ncbi:hypothetical protein LTR93_010760 [Exophiala xenobiotica]|nr:hypothetical protein LTR93_010760 [Exophiala xenobiotica]
MRTNNGRGAEVTIEDKGKGRAAVPVVDAKGKPITRAGKAKGKTPVVVLPALVPPAAPPAQTVLPALRGPATPTARNSGKKSVTFRDQEATIPPWEAETETADVEMDIADNGTVVMEPDTEMDGNQQAQSRIWRKLIPEWTKTWQPQPGTWNRKEEWNWDQTTR